MPTASVQLIEMLFIVWSSMEISPGRPASVKKFKKKTGFVKIIYEIAKLHIKLRKYKECKIILTV